MNFGAILLASAAAIAPVLAGHAYAQIDPPSSAARFAPPAIPLMLSRTVIRELSDGQRIVVTRRYKVQFVPSTGGYLLNGALIEVQVEAPPILAKLAEMERQRLDPAMFPIRFDAAGMIQPDAPPEGLGPRARRQLTKDAASLIAGSGLSATRQAEGSSLAGHLAAAAPTSPWPRDLFVTVEPERYQRRSIALPGGEQGEVEVVIRTSKLLPCGMPGLVERVITTSTAGTSRVSREVWTVAYTTPAEY